MAVNNLSTLSNIFKNQYAPYILEDVIERNSLLKRIQNQKVTNFEGTTKYTSVYTSLPRVAGRVSDTAAVPTPGQSTVAQLTTTTHEYYGVAGATYVAIEKANSPASLDNLATRIKDDCTKAMKANLNRVLLGNGTGKLARIASGAESPAGTYTYVVDNTVADFGIDGTRRLVKGSRVAVYASDGTTARFTDGYVSDVTSSGVVIVSDTTSATIADNDIIFAYGCSGSQGEAHGLLSWLDDGAAANWGSQSSYLGLTRASYDILKATVWDATNLSVAGTSGTATAFSGADLRKAYNTAKYNSADSQPTAIYGNPDMIEALIRLLYQEENTVKNMDVMDASGKMGLGFTARTWCAPDGNVLPLFEMEGLPANTLYMVDETKIIWNEAIPIHFREIGGEVLFHTPNTRVDSLEAWLVCSVNFTMEDCRSSIVLHDLSYTV